MATEKKLLYIKVAAPKTPKKRSRAGEIPSPSAIRHTLKKKCDEVRPSCSRCLEHGQDCEYGPVKPRQRRKREGSQDRRSSDSGYHEILDSYSDFSPTSYAHAATTRHADLQLSNPDTVTPCIKWESPELSSIGVDGSQYLGNMSAYEADNTAYVVPSQTDCLSEASANPFLTAVTGPKGTPSQILEFCSPSFGEFSQDFNERFLMNYFCNTFSHLIVLREDRGNPFQQLVLPLARSSQAVKGAIYALASAHLVGKGRNCHGNDEKSIQFHNEAIRNLAKLIAKGGAVDRNELLATIMLIVYYEVLVQRRRSNLVESHLKGAMAIMRNSPSCEDRTSIFLEDAFRFYDVIAALSSGTAPLSSYNTYRIPEDPSLCRPEQQQASNADEANALLGLATSLWPVIHRLSGLLPLKNELEDLVARSDVDLSKITAMQAEFDLECAIVETSLNKWQPLMPTECDLYGDTKTMSSSANGKMKELQSIFHNALAYRHSALVYLYRTIYNSPRRNPIVQHHASVSLVHCKATVLHEGPMGALLWPLFVASCEAVDTIDRHSARDTFQGITRRQGMANIDRAWEVVQEVWKRADKAETLGIQSFSTGMGMDRKDLWRRVSEDMGMAIVFG
ncbi:hypothetical protein E4U55_008131 [Claviceps digitariae]|nr:hypothetical protein E4U55_008131 [Claviceps digitariae]